MSLSTLLLVSIMLVLLGFGATASAGPRARIGATCADYGTQADAQRAADTIDANGDGIYCESLPCPCATTGPTRRASARPAPRCVRSKDVIDIGVSSTRYPTVLRHIATAIRAGWPRILRIHRDGAEQRRVRALRGWPTRPGWDRDEWPMAMARTTWPTHVAYVPSRQNRGAGSSIAIKLRRYCDGVRFQVVGY